MSQSGIFPAGKEPSIRTLWQWTKLRRIPHHKVGHFVYYDTAEVSVHIRTKLKVPARGLRLPLCQCQTPWKRLIRHQIRG